MEGNGKGPAPNPEWSRMQAALLRRKPDLKGNTLEQYELASRDLTGYDPRVMTQDDVDRVRANIMGARRGNGPRVIIVCIRAILRHVYGRGDLILKAPRYKRPSNHALEVEQIGRMLAVDVDDPLRNAVGRLLYEGSLRVGEVCRLNVEDFNFESREVLLRDAKTGNQVVSVPQAAMDAVAEYVKNHRPSEFVDGGGRAAFVSRNTKRRIGEKFVRYQVKRSARLSGVTNRVYPHLVRATSITHLLNAGANPATVQRHARHARIETTWVYNRPTQGMQRENLDAGWAKIHGAKPQPRRTHEDALRELAQDFVDKKISFADLKRTQELLEQHAPGSTQAKPPRDVSYQ